MINVLIYIKHHVEFIWNFIEWINSLVFNLIYGRNLHENVQKILVEFDTFDFKILSYDDLIDLELFFKKQPKSYFTYFNPHDFDLKSLKKKYRDKSFLMIGAFYNHDLIGYCFIRFFLNKQAFRGKIVGNNYQGRGIAKQMGLLTSHICRNMNFRLFATISKDNVKSLASSKAVNDIRIVKELSNNYLYVEYLLK